MATQGGTPAAVGRDGGGRRFGWRRHRPVPAPEPPMTLATDGDPIIIVPSADFVCCSYKGCGALRPLAEVNENRPCLGCGRV
ncbi:hypothetical protein CcI49_31700 [Frankia sp. CcI49]|nr:hypothetical protein CcI49_31700 [Frankia sp. CcI49]